MANVTQTLARVALIFAVVTALALAVAVAAGVLIIRRALLPLDRVAATAADVAELNLDRGEVRLPMRVPDADTNPNTEVGRLGMAVNRMLDHIAAAPVEPTGQRKPGAAVRRRRQPRVAHPTGRHPRLHRTGAASGWSCPPT